MAHTPETATMASAVSIGHECQPRPAASCGWFLAQTTVARGALRRADHVVVHAAEEHDALESHGPVLPALGAPVVEDMRVLGVLSSVTVSVW